jgi:hypothetical protein
MAGSVARFDTVALAEETIRDPRLRVADYTTDMANVRGGVADVIIGTDFLRAHRMLVSRSQNILRSGRRPWWRCSFSATGKGRCWSLLRCRSSA